MLRTALLLLAVCTPLAADDAPGRRSVAVSAQSEVWVAPDVALLHVSISNSDAVLAVAKQANDEVARGVARVIEEHPLKGDDYKLTDLQIGPRLSGRVVVGYTVERSLEFRLTDFSKIDGLLADLVETCGESLRVDSLQYRVADQRRHQVEARRLAVEYAREKAEHLAALNGMALGHAVSIHEGIEYNSSADGFGGFGGGFGGAGVSIDRPHPELMQTESIPSSADVTHRHYVGTASEPAAATRSETPAPPVDEPEAAPNAAAVERQFLTAVGQVNLTAAVTIEWELVPQVD